MPASPSKTPLLLPLKEFRSRSLAEGVMPDCIIAPKRSPMFISSFS
jgi:hypothetical protein